MLATRRGAVALCRSAPGRVAARAPCGVSTSLSAAPSALVITTAQPSTARRHASMFETGGKREQEGFLYQYDPMDVLGLTRDTEHIDEVKAAYEELKAQFGPNGTAPSKSRMQKVQAAYDILMDHESVYYTKQGVHDHHRKTLQLQVMPHGTSSLVQAKAMIMTCLVCIGAFSFFYVILFPVIKMSRAASRGMRSGGSG
eukprot:CAMPEP_0174864178 /NCGR_PEP_ID=MMETSP1114-20130205/57861_1 /TAXON_ID=312471 /ORGANISM="Neobodo designis, Strain CCAP 1951/1" /LENGTH=198 /DNA_ID=CAMNT_0016099265 /DNA_START=26 /DNA_END=619 /DNA_ORIENTATION=+